MIAPWRRRKSRLHTIASQERATIQIAAVRGQASHITAEISETLDSLERALEDERRRIIVDKERAKGVGDNG